MLNDGQKIVFHCDDGITRSAVIVYAVLRSLGHEPTKAEELIVKARYVAGLIILTLNVVSKVLRINIHELIELRPRKV
jgi:protein-tyrosine phosphatase